MDGTSSWARSSTCLARRTWRPSPDPDLLAAGVSSFKIEGRLKKPEYVANITHHYRTALDAASANQPVQFTARQIEEMELSFSRGFSPGWLQGNDHNAWYPVEFREARRLSGSSPGHSLPPAHRAIWPHPCRQATAWCSKGTDSE